MKNKFKKRLFNIVISFNVGIIISIFCLIADNMIQKRLKAFANFNYKQGYKSGYKDGKEYFEKQKEGK